MMIQSASGVEEFEKRPQADFARHPAFELLRQNICSRIENRLGDNESVDFYPNPGNWGDSLINAGTREFFRRSGIGFRERERGELETAGGDSGEKVAVVGGGGGWCRNWGSTPTFLSEVSAKYRQVILLPTSFERDFANLDLDNVVYFSRDRGATPDGALFCPDMAFCYPFERPLSTIERRVYFMRTDKERSSESRIPIGNSDISLLGDATVEASGFVELASRFTTVVTDRLHVALAAAMSEREVFLLEGNYGKNWGVFDDRTMVNFPNITKLQWCDLDSVVPRHLRNW